jgi:hypothetical protein
MPTPAPPPISRSCRTGTHARDTRSQRHELSIPSGEQTGFKLSHDDEFTSAGSYELMLDFDAHESVFQTG